jgi:hypothetical protein
MELGIMADIGWTIPGISGGASSLYGGADSGTSSEGTDGAVAGLYVVLEQAALPDERLVGMSAPIGRPIDAYTSSQVIGSRTVFPFQGVWKASAEDSAVPRDSIQRTELGRRTFELDNGNRISRANRMGWHLAHDSVFSQLSEVDELGLGALDLLELADDLAATRG